MGVCNHEGHEEVCRHYTGAKSSTVLRLTPQLGYKLSVTGKCIMNYEL